LVELKAVVGVVPREQERHAERSETTILRVGLLVVANVLNKLLDRNVLLVLVLVPACAKAGLIDEDVGVCGETRDRARRVLTKLVRLLGRLKEPRASA